MSINLTEDQKDMLIGAIAIGVVIIFIIVYSILNKRKNKRYMAMKQKEQEEAANCAKTAHTAQIPSAKGMPVNGGSLDVTCSANVSLTGPAGAESVCEIYAAHLGRTVPVNIPNSIKVGERVTAQGMGLTGSDGRKGSLIITVTGIERYKFCVHCGEKITAQSTFCGVCGRSQENG